MQLRLHASWAALRSVLTWQKLSALDLTGSGSRLHRPEAEKKRLAAAASEEDIAHAAEVARLMGCIEVGP